ncbi:MAG: ABC transporter permease [Methanoregulaceae archaeon]|nr:ABC transporter permease [Methanoregulaceae archaeon]
MRGVLEYLWRDMLRWTRGKVAVISSLVMPATWLIFVGLALPTSFTTNYLDFITPGILVLTMLTASFQAGSSLIFDKILGFLNKFLALPTPRESILLGKIFFSTARGLLQATVILVLAVLLGAASWSAQVVILTYVLLGVFGILIASFATTIALHLGDHDSYAAVNAMISMPLFFTSSALMPYSVMPRWLATLASINPVSFAIDAIRAVQVNVIMWDRILPLTGMTLLVLAVSIIVFRRTSL